ncbi:lytic polysaccharide monooxygenase, partial [Periconia macrospinosa]
MFFSTTTALWAFAASAANAHMIMAQPKPFGNPDNSPLSPAGSNYPCKLTGPAGGLDFSQNQFKIGENQTLSFSGSAVHGGGSCQLAVTMDKNPSKTSKFKVIHSIEGGCPGTSGPSTFSFPVPKELPNGEAVFAWTWIPLFSGQKEFYMNCAAITLSGGSSDTKGFDSLPDLAVTNIKPFCDTPEGNVYSFPNPGKSVQRIETGGRKFIPVCQNGGSSGGAQPSPEAQPGSAPTGNTSAPNPAAPTPSAQPSVPDAPSTQPSSAPGSGTADAGTCSTDGAIVCQGETQFGLCNHGKVTWQPVAPGTKCADGKIAKRHFTHRAHR